MNILTRVINWIKSEQSKRRLQAAMRKADRAFPGTRDRKREMAAKKASHRSTKSLLAKQREEMNAALGHRRAK